MNALGTGSCYVEEEGEQQGQCQDGAHVLPEQQSRDCLLAILVQRGQRLYIDGCGSAVAQEQHQREQSVGGHHYSRPYQAQY
jgi:hypothetical protein